MDDEDVRAIMQICSYLEDLGDRYGPVMSMRDLAILETGRSCLIVYVQYMNGHAEVQGEDAA